MVAATYNITVGQGTSFALQVALTDASGSAINLTGYEVKSQIRQDFGSPVLAAFGVTGPLGAAGTFVLSLTSAQTAALPLTVCKWDCLLEISTEVDQILRGTLSAFPVITQP
jgi:hypothetical protein